MRETWVQSPGWEDPLEEGMSTHSSILARRIPIDRGAWWTVASQRVGHDWVTKHSKMFTSPPMFPTRPSSSPELRIGNHTSDFVIDKFCFSLSSLSYLLSLNNKPVFMMIKDIALFKFLVNMVDLNVWCWWRKLSKNFTVWTSRLWMPLQ